MLNLTINTSGYIYVELFFDSYGKPTCTKEIDSYYLADFLCIEDERFGELELQNQRIRALELLNYWKSRMIAIEKGETKFVLFDLHDEYIGGFLLKRVGREFVIKAAFTQEIHGFAVSQVGFDAHIEERNIAFEIEDEYKKEWWVNSSALISGIEWSIEALLK